MSLSFISFTVTSNDTSCSSPAFISFICHVISPLSAFIPPLFAFTYVVPSGALSFTITFSADTSPVFFTFTVYVILSPAFTFPSGDAVFSNVIIGFFTSGVGSPSTIATFFIVPVAPSFTFALKLNISSSPGTTSTFLHTAEFSSIIPSLFIEPSIYSNCSGIGSVTSIYPDTFPVLVTFILYVISSPCFTFPFGSAVFIPLIFTKSLSDGFVSFPETTAVFLI